MEEPFANQPNQNISILLEIVPEEASEEVADVDEVARSIVDQIRSNGYTVKPKPTGKMGGPVFEILIQVATMLHDNKELIATGAASLEFLAAALGIIKDHTERHEERKSRLVLVPTTIEITMPTSHGPWTIKVSDIETAIKVIKELPTTEPEKVHTITSNDAIRVMSSVGRKQRHRKH